MVPSLTAIVIWLTARILYLVVMVPSLTATLMIDIVLLWHADIFRETFSRLRKRGVVPGVLYPTVGLLSDGELEAAQANWKSELPKNLTDFIGDRRIFLSINRFERKKVYNSIDSTRSTPVSMPPSFDT